MGRRERLQVFAGTASAEFADKVCAKLCITKGNINISRFPDGEINLKINEDVRGSDAFIIQSVCPPVNEHLVELLIMIDCLKRASAERVTAVIPYFGYARQDRKAEGRVPITAKLVANLLTVAGADRILTIDLHAAQIQGFFDIPVDHIYASPVMLDYFQRKKMSNLIVVSPDVGGIKMARAYAKNLNCDLAIVDKRRTGPEQTEAVHIIGEIRGKNVLMVDDMVSTGTSISEAATVLREHGARDIYICATHPVLCGNAVEKLIRAKFKEAVFTDTISLDQSKTNNKIVRILTVTELVGEAIRRIHNSESVSSLFV
ncbi:MAG: ribose-phosphate pyrophosphokinase [Planctomycetes bacterium]|nr:ribose-phosphate pyrophosphokinase [Planctomycetota bacterium]